MGEHELILPDRRRLAYAEYGRPDGHPVFYFHGSPSSRLEGMLFNEEDLGRHGLRVIAADRPGLGGSDFQAGRGFSDWPADVAAIADSLGLAKFSVWGYSGGAPYVAACAARVPERILSAVIVAGGWRMDWPEARAGLPLPNRIMLFLARRAPWLLGFGLKSMAQLGLGDPAKELASMKGRVAPPDYAWLARDPGRFRLLAGTLGEALRNGPRGAVWDLGRYVRPFDFSPTEVRVPITWFHGRDDVNARLALAERAVREMPGATLIVVDDAAHLSMSTDHLEAVAARIRGR